MVLVINSKVKHAIIVDSSSNSVTVIRYNAVPKTIKLSFDKDIGFSTALKRINNIVRLDDELYDLVANR